DKGTIFLDEIGEISENFQVKLLRVLQSGDIEKVGSSIEQKVDVRVIAATNIDLESAVKGKKFREDLYYRINVFKIELPPLRNRKEDIEALALHFLLKVSGELRFSSASINSLKEYEWKGNVRELESVINRAAIFAKSANRNLIQLADLPDNIVKSRKVSFEELVLESLRNKNFSHSSISETARELGNVNRTLISENFRGIVLKTLVGTNFDIEETVRKISVDRDEEIKEKVRSKIRMYLNNIDVDLANSPGKNFESIKQNFNSKYKNLPAKFHLYLDEVIKFKLNL
ncbi:MAG TPA: sigma 54-interacting transcriptional regulator, partial [Ignavibacteriaceae bacterium]|nr:sigma 54-interacting transcriptional regulator [Ignavibacteriaceae bacterium]